jgi:uncharacterized RDD family membrane protein YckC
MSAIDDQYRPPQAPAAPTDDDENALREALVRAEPGSIAMRVGASLVDSLFGAGIAFAVGFLKAIVLTRVGGTIAEASLLSSVVLGIVGPTAYHAIAESVGGATLGKAIFGLQVRSERLGKCSFGAALGRNAALYIDLLFCGVVGLTAMSSSRMKQRYGDRWAHTLVVVSRSVPSLRSTNLANGIIFGLMAWSVAIVMNEVVCPLL